MNPIKETRLKRWASSFFSRDIYICYYSRKVNKKEVKIMKKKLNKIIELPCEEDSKEDIVSNLMAYLVGNDDYIAGNILVRSDRFEAVDVVIYEGCSNIKELTEILTS